MQSVTAIKTKTYIIIQLQPYPSLTRYTGTADDYLLHWFAIDWMTQFWQRLQRKHTNENNIIFNPFNAKYISGVCYSVRQIFFVVNNKHATKFAAGSPLYWTPAVNRLAITSILGSGSLPNFSRNPLLWVPAVKGLKIKSAVNCCWSRRLRGWPQRRRKNSRSFPGFSRAINLLFHRLSQQCNPAISNY